MPRPLSPWLPCLLAALTMSSAVAQDPKPRRVSVAEVQIELVYRFASTITRTRPEQPPKGERPPFRIGTLGTDETVQNLAASMQKRVIDGRRIECVALDQKEIGKDLAVHCDALYIATSVPREQWLRLLEPQRSEAVVLLCAQPGFCAAGGVVQFFVCNQRPRFEVNRDALKARALRAPAALLEMSQKGPR
jgi:hypothetical protein